MEAEADDPAPAGEAAVAGVDAIARVADVFDYDTEQLKGHIILLRERYSDENDLPCVTYDEVLHALNSVLKLTGAYSDVGVDGFLYSTKLYRSLTDEQRKQGVDGLVVADLPEEQRVLARSTAAFCLIGQQVSSLRQARNLLVGLKEPHTAFQWLSLKNLNREAFGFRELINNNRFMADCPLDNRFRLYTSGYTMVGKGG